MCPADKKQMPGRGRAYGASPMYPQGANNLSTGGRRQKTMRFAPLAPSALAPGVAVPTAHGEAFAVPMLARPRARAVFRGPLSPWYGC